MDETLDLTVPQPSDDNKHQDDNDITVIIDQLKTPKTYQSGDVLGQGGMGRVLNGHDNKINRKIAVKELLVPSDEMRRRFIEEARITGQLEHSNIIPIHELGCDPYGRLFYTMKNVKGHSLGDIIVGLQEGDRKTVRKYNLNNLINIYMKVCDAVAFAHSRGVIHRDLKPDNIMVGEYGEVHLLDWGIAKVLKSDKKKSRSKLSLDQTHLDTLRDEDADGFTQQGQIVGSPKFMAPEQATGQLDLLDQRTDIYSLGAILYNILTLNSHVQGTKLITVLRRICDGKTVPISRWNPGEKTPKGCKKHDLVHIQGGRIPEGLAAVASKAISVESKDRYQKVTDLQKEIEAWQGGYATDAEHATFFKQIHLLIARNKAVFITIVIAGIFMIAGAAIAFSQIMEKNKIVQKELRERKKLEAKEKKRLENLQKQAQKQIQKAEALLEKNNPESIRAAEKALTKALFLAPGDNTAMELMSECHMKSFELAMKKNAWFQAEEKLDRAKIYGVPRKGYIDAAKRLETSKNARLNKIKNRVKFLMDDAIKAKPTVIEILAVRELVSMKSDYAVEALLSYLNRDIKSNRMALSAIAWMHEKKSPLRDKVIQQAKPFVLKVANNTKLPLENREAAVITLCRWGEGDAQLFTWLNNILAMEKNGALYARTYIIYLKPFAERVNKTNSNNQNLTENQLFEMAKVAADARDYKKAINLYKKLLGIAPHNLAYHNNLALIYVERGKLNEALNLYTQSLKTLPDPRTFVNRGNLFYRVRQFKNAMADYKSALKLNPNHLDAINNLAGVKVDIGQFASAIEDFNKLEQKSPNRIGLNRNRGICYMRIGKFKKALENYTREIALNKNDASTLELRGTVYTQLKKYSEALADFNSALKLSPGQVTTLTQRGYLHSLMKNPNLALADFNSALKTTPNNMEVLIMRANLLINYNKKKEAALDLKRAIAIGEQTKRRPGLNPIFIRQINHFINQAKALLAKAEN